MPSTILTSKKTHCQCAKRTFHNLQTLTNWIDGMLEGKSKHYLQRPRVALLAEDRMVNGLDQVHHHSHGRTVIGDMEDLRIEDRQVLTGTTLEVDLIDVHLPMNRGLLRHHQVSDDLTGATAICQHRRPMADTHYHPFPATDPMAIDGEQLHHQATPTSPATATTAQDAHANPMALGDHVSLTTDLDEARATPAIPGMDITMIARTAVGRTGIETLAIGIQDPATLGVSLGIGGMEGRAHGVRRGATGIGIVIGMQTFTGGGRIADIVRVLRGWDWDCAYAWISTSRTGV